VLAVFYQSREIVAGFVSQPDRGFAQMLTDSDAEPSKEPITE
jgi:hypothetical protein